MKILFDGQVFVNQSAGGVSRYFANLLSGLNERPDASARVLAPLYRNEYLSAAPMRHVIGLNVLGSWPSGQACWFANRFGSPVLSRLLYPDIAHETYFSPKPFVTRARRRVTTMYDMIHELFSPGHFTTDHKRASLARCDHVLCISHSTKKDLCDLFGFPAERASVVHLGYQDFSALRAPEHSLGNEPYFLYVGARAGYKNFETMLRAFAASERLVRDFRIICFGGGALTPAEIALGTELGLSERQIAQFGGSDRLLGTAYAGATALVYPSLYEGFGLPPLEAMSVGCPVVCSNTSSLPEVVGDAALLFDPRDVEALRHNMETVAHDASLRRQLADKGHARRLQFSWARCTEETLAVYRAIS